MTCSIWNDQVLVTCIYVYYVGRCCIQMLVCVCVCLHTHTHTHTHYYTILFCIILYYNILYYNTHKYTSQELDTFWSNTPCSILSCRFQEYNASVKCEVLCAMKDDCSSLIFLLPADVDVVEHNCRYFQDHCKCLRTLQPQLRLLSLHWPAVVLCLIMEVTAIAQPMERVVEIHRKRWAI